MLRMRIMPAVTAATMLLPAACTDLPAPLGLEESLRPSMSQSGRKLDVVEAGGVPYYADFSAWFIPTDGEWVAIVFKRSPDCIPPEFNLLQWLDFSLFGPGGAACPMVVDGHAIFGHPSDFENGIIPRQEHYTGKAVPVWFVPLVELEAAIADWALTIGELASLPGLIEGQASSFSQSIKNADAATGGNGNRRGSSSTTASGTLADGRSFLLHIAEKNEGALILHAKIAIR
jgi:hypothetical protein